MTDSGSRPTRAQTRFGSGQNSEFPLLSQPETGEKVGPKAYASPAEIAARHIRDALTLIRAGELLGLEQLAAIEARLFVALEQLEAPPTADERAGIEWWNTLAPRDRAAWLERSNAESVADAWACFKELRRCPCGERTPDDCPGVECPRWPL